MVRTTNMFAGELDPLSLYRTLETVQDGRAKRGVRYSVALVLTLIVIGKLVGMKTPEAIGQWVTERTAWLKEALPCPRERFPCVSTYRNVLRRLDAAQINDVLAQWLLRQHASTRCQEEPSRLVGQPEAHRHEQVALDGKTLRGTQGHLAEDQRKMHQVGLYETSSGVLLKEHIVGDKENALSRVNEFLTPQWVKWRIISADALYTQQKFCTVVVTSGGTLCSLPKATNRPCKRICVCFATNRLSIVTDAEKTRVSFAKALLLASWLSSIALCWVCLTS